jgi:glutaredoxin
VNTPTLYIKQGCPYCAAAMEFLDEHKIEYRQVDVRGNSDMMKKLHEVSGQDKTPTLDWDGDVLANFGVEELEPFVREHAGSA